MYRIGQEEIDAVARVIQSGKLFRYNETEGEVDKFEDEWAEVIGTKYAFAVSGGTPALIAALAGLGVGPGDEVIVPAYTFMATAIAVLAVGAIPVIAEIDSSLTIDPEDVKAKLSRYTKAVIPVHMLGLPCNMDLIMEIAEKHNLLVLEDACQADGGSYGGRRLGSIGNAGAFSFNHYKILTAGEGGAVCTNDREVFERAYIYHDGGIGFRADAKDFRTPIFIGSQFRSHEMQGAILREQIKKLPGILKDLRRIKSRLLQELGGIEGFHPIPSNDPDGDCGTTLALEFQSEENARAFAERVGGGLPIDSGKHVYSNWGPILNHRGSHNPLLNPFNLPANKDLNMDYAQDMCPKTTDHLQRTVNIPLHPDWDEARIEELISACKKSLSVV